MFTAGLHSAGMVNFLLSMSWLTGCGTGFVIGVEDTVMMDLVSLAGGFLLPEESG